MEKDYIKDLIISLTINILAFIVFYINVDKMNLFFLMTSTILTILISAMASTIVNRNIIDSRVKLTKATIYTFGNSLYLLGQNIVFNFNPHYIAGILNSTEIGTSQYVEIKEQENSLFSVLILIIVSFALHYISLNFKERQKDV